MMALFLKKKPKKEVTNSEQKVNKPTVFKYFFQDGSSKLYFEQLQPSKLHTIPSTLQLQVLYKPECKS